MHNEPVEWIPLRQAVLDVADTYRQVCGGSLCEPLAWAIEAIFFRLEWGMIGSRSKRYSIWIRKDGKPHRYPDMQEHNKNEYTEISHHFWKGLKHSTRTIRSDWITEEFIFGERFESRSPEIPGNDITGMAFGIQIDKNSLPLIGKNADFDGLQIAKIIREEKRGAPVKWKWEDALIAIIAEANGYHGLPDGYGAQAKISRKIADWFQANQHGEPAPSEIAKRAGKIIQAIEDDTKKANVRK